MVAAAAAEGRSVGLCWTRNEVSRTGVVAGEWEQLYASASSARAATTVKRCLFTDAPRELAARALDTFEPRALERLFDVVVIEDYSATSLPFFVGSDSSSSSSSSVSSSLSSSQKKKVLSRVKRMQNLKRSPFEITLFVDDDTVFCPHPSLRRDLEGLAEPGLVRLVEHALSKPRYERDGRLSRSSWDASCSSFFRSEKGLTLQGGAILVSDRNASGAFADDWIREYVDFWGGPSWRHQGGSADEEEDDDFAKAVHTNNNNKKDRAIGNDQRPLDTIARAKCRQKTTTDWRLAALPPVYNVRFLAGKTNFSVAVEGRITVLHSHGFRSHARRGGFLEVLHRDICDVVNKHTGPRIIQGFDALTVLRSHRQRWKLHSS